MQLTIGANYLTLDERILLIFFQIINLKNK